MGTTHASATMHSAAVHAQHPRGSGGPKATNGGRKGEGGKPCANDSGGKTTTHPVPPTPEPTSLREKVAHHPTRQRT